MPETDGTRRDVATVVLVATALLAFATPFGNEGTQAGVFFLYRFLLIGTGALCFWALGKERGPDFPAGLYLLVAGGLGLMLISLLLGPGWDPEGRTLWYQHVLFALFFIGLARFSARRSEAWKSRLLALLIACALVHMTLELTGVAGYIGTFVNRNYLGTYLLIGFASSLAIALFGRGLATRATGGALAVILLYGVTSTSSRGATLAAAGVVGLALMRHPKRRVALAIGALALAILTLSVLGSPNLMRKFADTGQIDPYNYDRIGIWSQTLDLIGEHPLAGVGLGQFEQEARRYAFPVEGTIGRYMKRINVAHSEYLQYAAVAGLPVAFLILVLLGTFLVGLFRTTGSGAPGGGLPVEEAAMLALAGVALHALVDNVWTAPVVVSLLATLALASSRLTVSRPGPVPASSNGRAWAVAALLALTAGSTLIPAMAYHANARAQEAYGAGRVAEAASLQRFAVTLWPNDPLMLTNLSVYDQDLYLRDGDRQQLETATAYLRRAQEASPHYLPARQEYAHTILLRLKGDPRLDAPIHARLIQAYESVLELDPYMPFVIANLAEAWYWSGDPDRAMDLLQGALDMEPNYVGAYLKLAEWKDGQGEAAEATRLRMTAASVVRKYEHQQRLTDYEAMLLGRPQAVAGVSR